MKHLGQPQAVENDEEGSNGSDAGGQMALSGLEKGRNGVVRGGDEGDLGVRGGLCPFRIVV